MSHNKNAGPVAGAKSGPAPKAGSHAPAPTQKPSTQSKNSTQGSTKGHVQNGTKPSGIGGTGRGCK